MAELVYALVLGTSAARLKSSSLFLPPKIMKVQVQSKKGLQTTLSIIVDKEEIKRKSDLRLSELQDQVDLKGFRKGKVPSSVIKNQFGKAIYGEIIDKILKESTSKQLKIKN